MKYLLFLLGLLLAASSYAQPTCPQDWGLRHFTLTDKKLGPISFYVDTVGIGRKAPLLVEVNGSGGLPLCFLVKKPTGGSFILNTWNGHLLDQAAARYHYVILDKPGTPFCDSVTSAATDMGQLIESYRPSAEYTRRLSLQWRVAATRAVISYLTQHGFHQRGSDIVAWGYSEGGQVVPRLAAEDKRITKVVAIVGAGLNQFYDELLRFRMQAHEGKISHQQAQDSVVRYLAQVRDIYQHPTATDRAYWGHSYQRWASFGGEVPLESLRQLRIPIYMLVGSADTNSPIFGLDYVPLEFARLGKTNLTYEVCVGCDHFLGYTERRADGQEKRVSRSDAYFDQILAWLASKP
jgi:pimeloyl-ACP methyl ester carboxylesterase